MYFNKSSDKISKDNGKSVNAFSSLLQATTFLQKSICDCLDGPTEMRDDTIFLPKQNISLLARVVQLESTMATEEFFLSCPDWDRMIYECSSAIGADQKSAVGMAQGSFMFGLFSTIMAMLNKDNPRTFETEFIGQKHRFRVYLGDIIGMGETPEKKTEVEMYWSVLKDLIVQRIGNQKIVYIKIFGSNAGNGQITGECRINNIKSAELSAVVAKIVEQWGTTQFGSQKQFFLLEQEDETLLTSPLFEREVIQKTALAMKLYEQCKTKEDYEQYQSRLEEQVGNKNLAQDLYMFIPEICLQVLLSKITFSEKLFFNRNGEKLTCYNTQLSSYTAIWNGVVEAVSGGTTFKDIQTLLEKFVSASATYNALSKALDDGAKLENLSGNFCTIYNVSDDYILR